MDFCKYQGMKLKDALCDISKESNEHLYIGARTSFFLIESPKEALNMLDAVSKYQVDLMHYRLKKMDEKIAITKKPNKHDPDEAKKAYEDKILWFKHNKREIKRYLSEFIPFADRFVLDVYERSLDGYAVIVEGDEVGDYWLFEEFIKYFPKKSQKFQAV